MNVPRPVRLTFLCVHVLTSVAWLGTIVSFLVFALKGRSATDVSELSMCVTALQWLGWWLVVPLCFAASVSGIVQSVISSWGLIQHYWVLIKLIAMILATILLMVHMKIVDELSRTPLTQSNAAISAFSSLAFDAALATLLGAILTGFSIFKPPGRIFDRR